MEDIYSNIKKNSVRAAGDVERSDESSNPPEVIYSEVRIKSSNQKRDAAAEEFIYSNVVFCNPVDLSASQLPGPNDPGDPSPEGRPKVTKAAQVKERPLLISLCALFFAVALVTGVLYGFGKVSHNEFEKQVREINSSIEQLKAENQNLTGELQQRNNSIEQLQAKEQNLIEELERTNEILDDIKKNFSAEKEKMENSLKGTKETLDDVKKNFSAEKEKLENSLKERKRSIEQLKAKMENLKEKPVLKGKAEHCADGWKTFSGKCYYFSTDKKTWTASRDACVAQGGDLVIINSKEETDFLMTLKPTSGRMDYWIGLTDAVKENKWCWLDGTKFKKEFLTWTGKEPDNWKGENNSHPDGEDCAVMELSGNIHALLDAFCDEPTTHSYICEACQTCHV